MDMLKEAKFPLYLYIHVSEWLCQTTAWLFQYINVFGGQSWQSGLR